MRFLIPTGGDIGDGYGVLTSYKHRGVPLGIASGKPWAGDNCAYTGFDGGRFFRWLGGMDRYRETCLFVVCPDVVGDAGGTLSLYEKYHLGLVGWPVAYVAQDGQERLPLPDGFDVLFVGGTTKWKESTGAVKCIERAMAIGKRIHIGRVNWGRRYRMFRVLPGSDEWTCDGTRMRFEGVDRTLASWSRYERQAPLLRVA